MNATKIKKIAQAAFRSEFGVEPKLKDIHLLEASGDRLYILFGIGKHEYRFNSYAGPMGSVWVGDGTLTISK
ncbi:MAG: hypothetical protein ACLSA6_00450 [Holdemania massiliensis]